MSSPKRKIILDTDPGYDDSCAIALAGVSDKLELLAITTVAGNQTIENVTNNALKIADYLDLKCPVAKGMSGPIISDLVVAKCHGPTGLDGVDLSFPESNNAPSSEKKESKLSSKHAVNLIIDLCLSNDEVTIVTIGPMTNVAMAIKMEPKIIKKIKEISVMGGSILYGNVTPAAEFNIHQDPEAADIVFKSGIPIRMHGLDVTLPTYCNENVIEKMKKIHTKESVLFCQSVTRCNYFIKTLFGGPYSSAHDSVAVTSLIDDSFLKYKEMFVEIDTAKGSSYGRTNCDQFGSLKKPVNAKVAVDIDVEKFWNIVAETYSKGKKCEVDVDKLIKENDGNFK